MTRKIFITKERCKEIFLKWYEEAAEENLTNDTPEDADDYATQCAEYFFEEASRRD